MKSRTAWLFVCFFIVGVVRGEDDEQTSGDVSRDDRIRKLLVNLAPAGEYAEDHEKPLIEKTIKELVKMHDPRLEEFFEKYRDNSVSAYIDDDDTPHIFVVGEKFTDEFETEYITLFEPLTGAPFMIDGEHPELWQTKLIFPHNKLETILMLYSADDKVRLDGVRNCASTPYKVDALPLLEDIAETDDSPKIRWVANESILLIRMAGKDPEKTTFEDRLDAIEELAEMNSARALPRIQGILTKLEDGDEEFADVTEEQREEGMKICEEAIERIEDHQFFVAQVRKIFQGLSYGSVLILMALGLAITFGLMGVINMAHGELMMVGAFATYETQLAFGHTSESPVDEYFLVALPIAFLAAAFVGLIMEWLVVRHLYNRPLESLLATWGVSLFLIQLARVIYGDTIKVVPPSWYNNIWEVSQDIEFSYSRLYLLGLCVICVCFVYFIMRRTKQGMLMRATMQNRDMAEGLGVRTRNVDRFTFALGSGIAGVAGYGWYLIGGVTPDMGAKNFIVDSFLVVVTGGVGELMGVVCSGLGIGIITKMIEPMEFESFIVGPVWAKVVLLALIVAFIQFRPSGLFAPKGRKADD